MTINVATEVPFGLDDHLPWMRARYVRLALVNHERHLARLGATDESTLIATANWLLWQRCLAERRHCVHTDLGLLGWDALALGNDIFVRANSWMYADGEDVTRFRGVSLGRKFVRHVSLALTDDMEFRRALGGLCERFSVVEILYFDHATNHGQMTHEDRLAVVRAVAREFALTLTDCSDPVGGDDSELPGYMYGDPTPSIGSSLRATVMGLLRSAALAALGWIARAQRAFDGIRPAALIVCSTLTAIPLLESAGASVARPLYLARWLPNKTDPRFLLRFISQGGSAVSAPRLRLSREDRTQLRRIRERVATILSYPSVSQPAPLNRFVAARVLGGNGLEDAASEVRWAERILDRFAPSLVVTDGFQNPLTTTFLELAQLRAIPTAVTWHGPFVQDVRVDVFGADPRVEASADFCLTWGKVHEQWLEATAGRRLNVRRIGCPVVGRYRSVPQKPAVQRRRVLIVQYSVPAHDLVSPRGREYGYFAETVRLATDLGFDEICFRLRPESRKRGYYVRVARHFGLDCRIDDTSAFSDLVNWADMVVGPVVSGAMIEALAAGRPYFPVNLAPNSVNPAYLRAGTVYSDFDSLRRALSSGVTPDQSALLEDLASCREIPDPCGAMWEAIDELIAFRPPPHVAAPARAQTPR